MNVGQLHVCEDKDKIKYCEPTFIHVREICEIRESIVIAGHSLYTMKYLGSIPQIIMSLGKLQLFIGIHILSLIICMDFECLFGPVVCSCY